MTMNNTPSMQGSAELSLSFQCPHPHLPGAAGGSGKDENVSTTFILLARPGFSSSCPSRFKFLSSSTWLRYSDCH